jgi:hypothetical protein
MYVTARLACAVKVTVPPVKLSVEADAVNDVRLGRDVGNIPLAWLTYSCREAPHGLKIVA